MKKALSLFILSLVLVSAGLSRSSAQDSPAPAETQAGEAKTSKDAPVKQKGKKARKKAPKKAAAAEAAPAKDETPATAPEQAPAPKARAKRAPKQAAANVPAPDSRPMLKTLDTKKANFTLFATMERLETLIALYDNLKLQVSENTFNKAAELERACNKAAADFFKIEEPDPNREAVKTYKGLLNSALKGVKAFKDVKDRIIPEETEKALGLSKELNAAVDEELAGAKLMPSAPSETSQAAEPVATMVTEPTSPVDSLNTETETLAALAELRSAIASYKTEEGKYPKHLGKLTPKYIPSIPAINAADHQTTTDVLEIDSTDYDENLHQAITDTGKWLYFTNKKSSRYGRVYIDCSHKDAKGVELFKAGEGK